MRIGRTLPPAAAPIYPRDILSGIKGHLKGHRELDRFETELKDYFGVRHCFLLSSGKAALTIILQALRDLQPDRDEVLIPAFTCYSVPSAIVRTGLKVRLCDMNPDTLDFDFKQLSRILSPHSASQGVNKPNEHNKLSKPNKPTSRLLCIIPIHLFGIPSDIRRIRELFAGYPKVTIVEDAAQAIGGEWNSKKLGTFGDISFFSLGRGKALSTVEGGIILTDRDDIADKIGARIGSVPYYSGIESINLLIKTISLSLFLHPSLYWFPNSLPFLKLGKTPYDPHFKMRKMSAFQAGLAKGWQRKLRRFRKTRTKNSRHWISIITARSLHHYISRDGGQLDLVRFPVRIDDSNSRAKILLKSNRMGRGIAQEWVSRPTFSHS
jgi:hypothetical protein